MWKYFWVLLFDVHIVFLVLDWPCGYYLISNSNHYAKTLFNVKHTYEMHILAAGITQRLCFMMPCLICWLNGKACSWMRMENKSFFVSTKPKKKLFCAYGQNDDESGLYLSFCLSSYFAVRSHICIWGPEVYCHEIQLVSLDPQASSSFDYNSSSSSFETLLFSISSLISSHEGSAQSKAQSHNVQGP